MDVFSQIIRLLDDKKVKYELTEHAPVRTSEEAANIRGAHLSTGTKTMVIKAKNIFVLMALPADRKIDWKKVKDVLEVKDVRFATEEEAERETGCKVGSVCPFGNLFNIPTYFDPAVLLNEWIYFNPGSKTHSIKMKSKDLVDIISPVIKEISKE